MTAIPGDASATITSSPLRGTSAVQPQPALMNNAESNV